MKNKKILNFKRTLLKFNLINKANTFKNNIITSLIVKKNKFLKNYFIPNPRNSIHIETSSVCNLKCKFCAYVKRDNKQHPSQTMDNDHFNNVLKECVSLNYKYIGLTPATGDIFMDKKIFQKLDILENTKEIKGFFFYTNFIPINKENIKKLLNYSKLKFLGLSIYGHDENTFINFTNSTSGAYKKLLDNLNEFENLLSKGHCKVNTISINLRSEKNYLVDKNESRVSELIRKILKVDNVIYTYTHEYNNWGNLVKKDDVKNLNINFQDGKTKKNGACSLIFGKNIIGVNGNVNACACRDANFTLRLGNVFNDKLSNILSKKNKTYTDLIENQSNGKFHSVCENCDFYTSIHLPTNRRGFSEVPEEDLKSIEDFYKITN